MGTIAQEISRIQGGVDDVWNYCEDNGVSVPVGTTVDQARTYLDQIPHGGGITEINDLKYMFIDGARLDIFSDIMNIANRNITDFTSFAENASNINFLNINLQSFPTNLNLTRFAKNATGNGTINLKNKVINSSDLIIGTTTNNEKDYSNIILDLENAELINNEYPMISGSYHMDAKHRDYYLKVVNLNKNTINYTGGILLSYINCYDDILDLSNLTFANATNGYKTYQLTNYVIAKNVILPDYINGTTGPILDNIYGKLYNGLLTVENLTLPTRFKYNTSTSLITSVSQLFYEFQSDVTDPTKMLEIDMEKYFPVEYLDRLAPTSNLFGDVNNFEKRVGHGGPRGFINVHLTNNGQYVRPFGTSTINVYNDVCRFTLKNGTTWASNTYTSTCSLYLAYLWRGNASSIPDRDVEGKTTEEYFVEFLNSLGENTSGAIRNIRIYSGLYNTISQATKQIAIDKGYTLISTSTS